MNLGQLIDTLKIHKPTAMVIISAPVVIYPGRLISYRGYYEQLAIEPLVVPDTYGSTDPPSSSVEAFIAQLEGAVGSTFTGYKGGEFEMHRGTPMWIAASGESSPRSCRVTGVTNLYDHYARIEWVKHD